MKTLVAQETAAIGCAAGYSTHLRVKVADSTATLVDVSDYLVSLTYDNNLDMPMAACTVSLARTMDGVSVAPYDGDSPLNSPEPLLYHWRLFTVEVAVVPLGVKYADATTWREEFRGRIDDITSGDEVVSFQGYDFARRLQRVIVDADRTYGSALGVAVETIMQSILDDNGLTDVTVVTPSSPLWLVTPYKQDKVPVIDALKGLADQLGWELRYCYDSVAGTLTELRFYEPDRSNVTPSFTFPATGACAYRAPPELRETGEDLRNVWYGTFTDTATLDAAGNPTRTSVTVSDATSISLYDQARVEIAEAATSNINTTAEMTRFLNAGLADCKDPKIVGTAEVPYFPWVELGDVVALGANGTTLSAATNVHVVGFTHTLENGNQSTKLSFRGDRPTTSMLRWVRREARPTMRATTNPSVNRLGPNAPTGLTTVETASGFRLSFLPPTTGPKAEAYELHVSTSSGFTPSDSTVRVVGAATEMVVTDLTPGTTYYAKVVPRTSLTGGDRGTATAQETLVPRYVEPRTLQPYVVEAFLPRNPSFEANNSSGSPPDAYTFSHAWNTDAEIATDSYSGARAVQFNNTGVTCTLTAQPFTVRVGEVWVFSVFYKQTVGTTTSGTLALTYLDDALAVISTVSVTLGTSAVANTWTRATQRVTMPSTARYAELSVTHASAYTGVLMVDGLDMMRSSAWTPQETLTFANLWASANLAVYGAVTARVNDLGEVEFRGVAVAPTPAPAALAAIFNPLPAAYRPSDFARVFDVVTGGGVAARITIPTTGVVTVSAAVAGDTISFDGIRYFIDG